MFVALSPYIGRGNGPEVAQLPRSLSNTSVESVSSLFPPTTPPVTMKILNGYGLEQLHRKPNSKLGLNTLLILVLLLDFT